MPTYDYECQKCGQKFEIFHSMNDNSEKNCDKCGSKAKKLISPGAGIIFKGSGFYVNDYKKNDSSNGVSKTSSSNNSAVSGSDSGSDSEINTDSASNNNESSTKSSDVAKTDSTSTSNDVQKRSA